MARQHSTARIAEERALTRDERVLIEWLLEHGEPGARSFLPQLAETTVIGRCPCGCVSVDLAVGGRIPPEGVGLAVLSDYVWHEGDLPFGVFGFAKGGFVAGLDVYSFTDPVKKLPDIERLTPANYSKNLEQSPLFRPPRLPRGTWLARGLKRLTGRR